ncbi:MAG: hypothetical protein IPM17_15910 [Verrucomicrobia bacterium]|nr:hypothetical protein [Verrucomicrobiota bacterium]
MNSKVPLVILVILAVALGAALFLRHHQANADKTAAALERERLQKTLTDEKAAIEALLAASTKAAESLKSDLAAKTEALQTATSQLTEVKLALDQAQLESKNLRDQLAASQAAVAERDARIQEMAASRSELEQHATDLKSAIAERDALIADTRRQLAAAGSDREFLLKELRRLQSEKGELERQFNDLASLKEQMRKLKEQYAVSKRLEWSRRGLADLNSRKGGEILQRGFSIPSVVYSTDTDLNVEVRRDGPAVIVPAPPK